MRKMNLALLSEEAGLELPTDEETSLVESGLDTAVEDDLIEEVSSDIEEAGVVIDDATDSVEELDGISQIVEASPGEELDPVALEMFRVCYTRICKRNGLKPAPVVATESFGKSNGKRVALESIAESIKKFFAAIMAGIQRAWEWLKDLYKTLTDKRHKLNKMAEAMEKTAARLKDEKAKSDTIPQAGFSTMLTAKGALVHSDKLAGAVEVFSTAIEKSTASICGADQIEGIKELVDVLSKSVSARRFDGDTYLAALDALIQKQPKLPKAKDQSGRGEKLPLGELPLPIGNKSIFSTTLGDTAAAYHYRLGDSQDSKAAPASDSHATMTGTAIMDVCKAVREHLKTHDTFDANIERIEVLRKELAALSKLDLDGIDGKAARHLFMLYVRIATRVMTGNFITLNGVLRTYSLNFCAAALQLSNASLKQYSIKEEEKATSGSAGGALATV